MAERKISPKSPLENSDATDSSPKLVQNSQEFIEENLKGALLDWLKKQPLYQDGSAKDKSIQENIVNKLADGLMSVIELSLSNDDNIDTLLLEEIKKHVKKFPIDPKRKSDQSFVDELPVQLLGHLKNLQLFNDISRRDDDQSSINMNVSKWINSLPLSKLNSFDKVNLRNLKGKLVEGIKQTDLQYESKLREETRNFLGNIPLKIDEGKEKEKLLGDLEDTLIETLSKKPPKLRLSELSNKFVIETVEQWVKTLDFPKPDDNSQQDNLTQAKNYMITTLSNTFVYADEVPLKNMGEVFQDATTKFLENIPGHTYKLEDIEVLVKSLQDYFKEYSRKYPMLPISKPIKKKAAVLLLEDIAEWVKKLPVDSDSPEEQLESEKIKLQFESKLIHKISEMNMNLEVFNDDFLYEDILEDEIDNLLRKIPNDNVQNNIVELRKDLLDIILRARQSIRDENANQIYKKQLHETISKNLPSTDWSEEALASLEVLKDNVADAFINMRYVGNDLEEINKLKSKINDEIYKFCNEYLKRCPATPLDTKKLNQKLYDALNNIAEPQNESFRGEVEIVKLKHEINNWIKKLSMKDQDAYDKLQTNKMVAALAKKIHDIENEKDIISAQEYEEKIRKEIKKFLNKQPLRNGKEDEINYLAGKLIENLSDTEEMRKLNASKINSYSLPKRNPQIRMTFKDKSISPCPDSQTIVKDCSLGVCLGPRWCLIRKSSSMQTPCVKMQAVGSQMGMSPTNEENINEDCWNNMDEICTRRGRPQNPRLESMDCRLPREVMPRCPQTPECLIPRQDSPCTQSALKSCLIARPYPLQPLQIQGTKQHQMRDPYESSDYDADNHDYQPPCQPSPPPCRPAPPPGRPMPAPPVPPEMYSTENAQAEIQSPFPNPRSNSTPYSTSELNDRSQTRPPAPRQLPETTGPGMYNAFPQPTVPMPDVGREVDSSQRQQASTSQYGFPSQPRRNTIESQYIPSPPPGSGQMLLECPSSCMASHHSQDQSWLTGGSSISFARSQPTPCQLRPPRPPPCLQTQLPTPGEEYGCEPSGACPRLTRLGSFDHVEPITCLPRARKWGRARNTDGPWQTDRRCFHSDDEYNQREGKRCRCTQKHEQKGGTHGVYPGE